MRDDGNIDYSRYTRLELEEALSGINKDRYPKNYANLRSAYEQLAPNHIEALEPSPVANHTSEREVGLWHRFWQSRPVMGMGGAICLWWAYDLYTNDSCPSGKKLISTIIRGICDNFGHEVSAGIPFAFGLGLLAYAALPKRKAGA